jgi:hypothetical protein
MPNTLTVLTWILSAVIYPQEIKKKTKGILWQENRPLTWADFKGRPEQNSSYKALTKASIHVGSFVFSRDSACFIVKCYFYPDKSWVNISNPSLDLLAHEQLHFDIAELYTRKLRKRFLEYKFYENFFGKDIDIIYKRLYDEYIKVQEQYDKETDHSTVKVRQLEWSNKISVDLKKYADYKMTSISLPLHKKTTLTE